MKKTILLIVIFSILLSSFTSINFSEVTNEEINIFFDNEKIEFAINPVYINDTLMVPMRQFFESLDANVNWIHDSREILAYRGNMFIKLQIENGSAYKNGKEISLNAAPIIKENRTLVPLRFIANTFDMKIKKDENNIYIQNNYRDNIYTFLGKTFYKKYYLKDEEIEFSLPYNWNKKTEYDYTYSLYDVQKYKLNISVSRLDEGQSLNTYINNIKKQLLEHYGKKITISKTNELTKNNIDYKVLYLYEDENEIESESNTLDLKFANNILYFFEYNKKVFLYNFNYTDNIQEKDAVGLTNNIINSIKISNLNISRDKEHYLEYKKFFELNTTLEMPLYSNIDINNNITLKGTIEPKQYDSLKAIVEKNGKRKTFIIPIENNQFNQKIYAPFGLGKHNITITTDRFSNYDSINSQSIIEYNKKDSEILLQFSVVNSNNKNILYLIPSEKVLCENEKMISTAKLIALNKNSDYQKAEALYNWIFKNIELDPLKKSLDDSVTIFENSKGNILEINILYTTFLRSLDIPARILKRETSTGTHIYNTEIYINGRWIVSDIGTEIKTYQEGYSSNEYFNIYDQNYFEKLENEIDILNY